jgi:hypothetical protein
VVDHPTDGTSSTSSAHASSGMTPKPPMTGGMTTPNPGRTYFGMTMTTNLTTNTQDNMARRPTHHRA